MKLPAMKRSHSMSGRRVRIPHIAFTPRVKRICFSREHFRQAYLDPADPNGRSQSPGTDLGLGLGLGPGQGLGPGLGCDAGLQRGVRGRFASKKYTDQRTFNLAWP